MSRTIDEKVVEMRFDNQNFEKNVAQSMSTLDKLKSALNFDGAANAFSGISSAANKLDFGGVSGAIESVGEKFSWLETIAVGALLNIGAQIESKLVNTLKSVTIDQVSAGFDKYADKTKAVQTIMAATGKEIGEVSEQLERLMWYTDETSYSFSDMVQNVGSFVSNGVELSEAVTAMEGISNWAAISGKGKNEAARAMYNLSQALAIGQVQVQDWKSIELAGMATEAFKKLAIQTAVAKGTLKEFYDDDTGEYFFATFHEEAGEAIADVEVDWMGLRDTLKEDWFNKDVLVSVLKVYGEFTDKLSQAYDDINSQEGIDVTTSELIKMTNQFMDNTLDMEQAMAITGKTAEELTELFSELGKEEYAVGRQALAAAQEARTFEDAIEATKDAVSTQFMRAFELIFGNYEEAKVLWTDLSNELWEIFAGPLSRINDVLHAWRSEKIGGRDDLIEGIKNLYRAFRSVVDPITEAWEAIFPPMTYKRLAEIVAGFKEFTDSLILGERATKRISASFEGVFSIMRTVSGFITTVVKELAWAFASSAFGGVKGLFLGISTVIKDTAAAFETFALKVAKIKSAVDYFKEGDWLGIVAGYREQYPVLTWLVETFDKLKDSLGIIGGLFSKFISLNNYLVYYGEAGEGIAGVVNIIYMSISHIINSVKELVKLWTGIDVGEWLDPIEKSLRAFERAVEDIQAAGWFDKIKEDFFGIGAAIRDTFGPDLKETVGYVFEAMKTIAKDWIGSFLYLIGDGTVSLEGFFKTLDGGLVTVQNFIKENETLRAVMDGIKEAVKMIADFAVNFLSIRQIIETYKEAGGGVAGVIEVINSKLKLVFDLVGNLVKRFTGIDISGIGDGILLVIKSIEEGVIRLADRIAKMLGWENNPFGAFLESTESSFEKLKGIFAKFAGADTGGLTAFADKVKEAFGPLGSVFEGFGAVLYGAWSVVQSVIPLIGQALQWLGGVLVMLAEKLQGMTFSDILDIIKIIVTLKQIANIQKLIKGFTGVLDEVEDTLVAWQTKLRAEALVAIATAILMIAGALVAISLIPTENLIWALGAIVLAIAALTASIYIISGSLQGFFAMTSVANIKAVTAFTGVLVAFAKVMIDVALAIGIIVLAIKVLAGIQNALQAINNLKSMLAGIVVSLIAIVAAVKIFKADMGDMAAIGSSILLVATALGVLAIALKLFDNVNWSSIGKMAASFGVLAGITVGMVALIDLFDMLTGSITKLNEVGKGMLSMAAALGVLVGVLYLLNYVPFSTLLVSVLKLGVALAALAYVAIFMNTFSDALGAFTKNLLNLGKALLYIGIGVAILGVIGKIIGDSAEEIADAAVDLLVTVMDAIIARTDEIVEDLLLFIEAILRGLADHTPEIVSLCVEILAGIFKGVREALAQGDVSGLDLAAGTGLLGGLIGIVILLKKSKVDGKDFLKAAIALAGAAVLLFEIGVFFAAFGAVAEAVGATDAIKSFGKAAEAIVEALIGGKGGVLLLFTSLLAFVVLYAKFRNKLPDEKGLLEGFEAIASLILWTTALVDELGGLFVTTGGLLQLFDWVASGQAFGKDFDNSAIGWIKKAGEFFTAIADIFREDAGIGVLFTVIAGLMVLVNKLGFSSSGGSGDAFGNIVVIIAEVVAIIDALGILLGATGAIIDLIDYGVQSKLGESKSVIGWVEKAGEFFQAIGEAVGKLIGGLAGGLIEGTTENLTQDMINILKGLGEVLLVMSEASFISGISLFTGGPIGLAVVGSELGGLAPGFRDFCDQIKDIPADIADKALVCAEALKYLIEAAPKEGGLVQWITGHVDLEKFGSGLRLLGVGLMGYQTAISGLDAQLIEDTKNSVATVIEMTTAIPKNGDGLYEWINGKTDLKNFGEGLESLGGGLLKYSQAIDGIDSQVIEDTKVAVATIIELASAVPNTVETTWFWGLFKSKETSGMDNFGDNLKSLGEGLVSYSDSLSGIKPVLITNTSNAVGGVVDMGIELSKIKETDTSNITRNAKAIATLGENFYKYYDSVKDMDTQKVHLVNAQLSELVGAFSNMDEEFEGKVTTFGTTIATKLANAIKGEASTAVMYGAVESLLSSMNVRINSFINGSVKGQNGTAVYGGRIIERLVSGLGNEEKRKLLEEAVKNVVNSIGEVLNTETEGFSENGAALLEALGTGLSDEDTISLIRQRFIDFFTGIIEEIEARYEEFKMTGKGAVDSFVEGAQEVDVEAKGEEIGGNFNKGTAKGVEETASLPVEAAKAVAGKMVEITKQELQVKSPSRLMELIGQYFDEGLAKGIFNNIPMVGNAVTSLMTSVKNGVDVNTVVSMMKGFGFDISDSFVSSMQEAALDPTDLGDLFGMDFLEGKFDNLTSLLGNDTMMSFMAENFGGSVGESLTDGVSEYLNADMGSEMLGDFVVDGMGGSLDTYADYSYECGYDIGQSESEGYLDGLADGLTGLSDTTIQGPTVSLVADTSQVEEAFDGLTHFHGETFQTNGELDAFLLAFDNMDSSKQLNFLTQYAEHGNTDMANYLQRRRSGLEGQEYSDQLFYNNVQQTATEISQSQQTANENLMAKLEETNANLLKIHEELIAFHATVGEFDDMQVVLDTGTLVGEMTPYIDEKLNNRRIIGGRMVVT